jgi:hypothetical protein
MKVLVIAFFFAPSNSIGAVRMDSLAAYLVSRGADVRVIAGGPAGLTVQDVGPDAAVLVRHVPGQGLTTRLASRMRARRRQDSARVPAAGSAPPAATRHSLGRNLVSSVGRSILYFPDSSLPWARAAYGAGIGATRSWRPDVILVSGPPFSSFLTASRLSRRLGVPWIADYRDLWSNSTYYGFHRARQLVDTGLERLLLRGVAAVVTVSEPLRAELSALHHRRSAVVLNGHEVADECDRLPGRLPGVLNLVYSGQLYAGKRDPGPVFRAIAMLGVDGEGIRVHYAGPDGAAAAASARREGCADNLVDHGEILRREALGLQRRADVLLLLMWNNAGEAGVYSGKLFEYLFARRPILMLGWPHGVAAELIRSRNAGLVLNDPGAIAAQLRMWVAQQAGPGGIPPLPESVHRGLTREEQNSRYAEIIQGVVATGSR